MARGSLTNLAANKGGATEKVSKPKDIKSSRSGLVPESDVRLTANIRADLHQKLKIEAVMRRTTMGELIEELIEQNL